MRPGVRRFAWFAGIWAASVTAIGLLSLAIRAVVS